MGEEKFGKDSGISPDIRLSEYHSNRNINYVLSKLLDILPKEIEWAIDGSLALSLQGIDIRVGDIDILTDMEGAYAIESSLGEYRTKRVKHSLTAKYESHFGKFSIEGINIDVMGDLRVFRHGDWSTIMNPSTVPTVDVDYGGRRLRVVSLEFLKKTGYFEERMGRNGQILKAVENNTQRTIGTNQNEFAAIHDKLKEKLMEFFDAENSRDWNTYRKFLHPDVEWIAYSPPRRKTVSGIENYVNEMTEAYKGNESKFKVLNIAFSYESNIVMAELEMDSRRSVDIFEFEDGLIRKEREYYDDILWGNYFSRKLVNRPK